MAAYVDKTSPFMTAYVDENTAKGSATKQVADCEHVVIDPQSPGVLSKRTIKDSSSQSNDLRQPCPLCTWVYPFWESFANRFLVSSPYVQSSAASSTSDVSSINSEPDEPPRSHQPSVPLSLPERYKENGLEFGVSLDQNQLGEAYHALICALIARHDKDCKFKIHVKKTKATEKDEDTKKNKKTKQEGNIKKAARVKRPKLIKEAGKNKNADDVKTTEDTKEAEDSREIRDLLDWYRLKTRSKMTDDMKSTKKTMTAIIAAFFRYCNSLEDFDLFGYLRDCLNIPLARIDTETTQGLHFKYFQPTYAAKYWLNRYLRLTGQGTGKLPKNDEISRLAVIHIRGDSAQSSVGREMDDEMLEYVAKSIACANKSADPAKDSQFTHVILYGDFDYPKASHLKEVVENAMQQVKQGKEPREGPTLFKSAKNMVGKAAKKLGKKGEQKRTTGSQVEVLYVTRPWKPVKAAAKDFEGMNRQVVELWEKFRDFDFDHLPVQVKILAIWNTLCQRYYPKMCVIGHRSGFIEGAALIGIPVFYLNNERENFERKEHRPGHNLWGPVKNPEHDRLRELADVVDRIIPVEVLRNEPTKEVLTPGFPPRKVFQVHKAYKSELSAALYMYMCCNLVPEFYKFSRLYSCLGDESDLQPGQIPVWTARVAMMHDICREHTPEQQGRQDTKHFSDKNMSRTGQEWLRQRFSVATKASEVLL